MNKIVENQAYRRLVSAILLQAVADLRRDSELDRVNAFVSSWWFEALCSEVDIDPVSARRALAQRALITDRSRGLRKVAR